MWQVLSVKGKAPTNDWSPEAKEKSEEQCTKSAISFKFNSKIS